MYEPLLTDKRVIKRLQPAFGFTVAVARANKPKDIYNINIKQAYGDLGHPLGRWIKSVLLVETDSHYNMLTGKTKRYLMNVPGVAWIAETLGYPEFVYNPASKISFDAQIELFYRSYAVDYFQMRYNDQLMSGDFEYNFSSNRYWNGIQGMRRETRSELLKRNGYTHQYDIQTAAPTLLFQHWQNTNHFIGNLVELRTLEDYILNKSQVRHSLANETGIEYDKIKMIINALTNGAVLAKTPYKKIYQDLDKQDHLIDNLKGNTWVNEYQRDIGNLWTGIGRGVTPDGNQKWQIYYELEFSVMRAIYDYLEDQGIKYFKLHDCFVADRQVDVDEVLMFVKKRSGFDINFDYKDLSLGMQPCLTQVCI